MYPELAKSSPVKRHCIRALIPIVAVCIGIGTTRAEGQTEVNEISLQLTSSAREALLEGTLSFDLEEALILRQTGGREPLDLEFVMVGIQDGRVVKVERSKPFQVREAGVRLTGQSDGRMLKICVGLFGIRFCWEGEPKDGMRFGGPAQSLPSVEAASAIPENGERFAEFAARRFRVDERVVEVLDALYLVVVPTEAEQRTKTRTQPVLLGMHR